MMTFKIRPCSLVGRALGLCSDPVVAARVRVASALAICSRLGWPAAGGSGRTKGQYTSVSGADRVQSWGHVKLSD